ncbi:MAG TPA: phosphodiester glycosidase family protein [Acidobacteriota bacterium]|nr:phosphodiester glycosidase family protein [Acidobacteriota bacterium]
MGASAIALLVTLGAVAGQPQIPQPGTPRAGLPVQAVLSAEPASSPAQEGLEYQHLKREGPLSIHVLRVDPARVEIKLVRALNDGLGRETVSSLARRSGARAAVNAGFFTIGGRYDGLPAGVLKVEDRFYSAPTKPRGALGWRHDGQALMGRLLMSWTLATGSQWIEFDGLNSPRGRQQVILYSWAFHRTTMTYPGGQEWALDRGRIVAQGGNDLAIPVDGYVISAGPEATRPSLPTGSPVRVDYRFLPQGQLSRALADKDSDGRWVGPAVIPGQDEKPSNQTSGGQQSGQPAEGSPTESVNRDGSKVQTADAQAWQSMDYIVGGAGLVLQNGRVTEDYSTEQTIETFITNKHPRTAVGFSAEGSWVVVVVDGRQPELSIGLTLVELGALMKELGCRDALNLDGGGSTTFVHQGKVMNTPSDFGQERPVSDAIVFK